jgi:Uma2 family endonuclease
MAIAMERQTVVIPANWVPGPKQGEWTYHQYAALPDDGHRYEIIDGVLLMTPAPGIPHQKAAQQIFRLLATRIEDTKLGQVFIAPVDVELAPNLVVQPDVMVVLKANEEKITSTRIIGSPDLVVEVSSPSTIGYDRREKQDAYARAGVPEYWIAHPGEQTIEIMTLENQEYVSLGIFSGKATLLSKIVPTISEVAAEKIFV